MTDDTKTLQERLRADAVEIAGWGAGNEAANVREAADALDAKDTLLREAREVLGPFARFVLPGIDADIVAKGPSYRHDGAIINSIITAVHLVKARALLLKLNEAGK